jgi:serine phosphatase RsbU (regulator of sigma subunit)
MQTPPGMTSVQRGSLRLSVEGAARRSEGNAQLVMELNGLRIAAACQSASKLGGDFYLLHPHADGRTVVIIGDVCGRGAAAARWMSVLLPEIRQRLDNAELSRAPARLLNELDRAAAAILPDDTFATAMCVVVDPLWREVVLANAGHVPALIKRGRGGAAIVGRASGPPLGLLPGSTYRDEHVRLGADDMLVLMTDGLLEAVEDDLDSLHHLLAWLDRTTGNAEVIGKQLLGAVFDADNEGDDRTLLSIELDGLGRARTRTPLVAEAG